MVRAAVLERRRPAPPPTPHYRAALLDAGLPTPVELLPKRYIYGGHPACVLGVDLLLVALCSPL